MRRTAGWLLVLAAAAGCSREARPELFSDDEIARSLADLDARLAANARRSCPAPQVRADVTPGSGTPVLAELFGGKGPAGDCLTNYKRKDDPACGPIVAARLAKAAAFTDACSPFQPGVGQPSEAAAELAPLHIAEVTARYVGELAKAGRTDEAVQVALDGLRVMQDLARGHVDTMEAMLGAGFGDMIGTALDAAIDTATPGSRAAAVDKLDALIAGMPRFADILAGEREQMDLQLGASLLRPGWTPPGGWAPYFHGGAQYGSPRDEGAAWLVASAERAEKLARACPAEASYRACAAGLEAGEAREPFRRGEGERERLAHLYGDLARENVPATRRAIIDQLNNGMWTLIAPKGQVRMHAHLIELRMHLAGTCPTGPDPDDAHVVVNGASVTVAVPTWAVLPAKSHAWTFSCVQ